MKQNNMKSHTSVYRGGAGWAQGFSLIELMVAIAIGLIILAALLTLFVNTSGTRNEIDRMNRQIENGRYATELLREDVQLAGFFGEMDMVSVAAAPATLPDPCSTTLQEQTYPAGGNSGILRLAVQGVNDYSAGLSCLSGANAVKPGTDVLVVRRVKTCVAGAAGCDALTDGKPYLQVSMCATPTVVSASTLKTHAVALKPNTTEFVHLLKDCTTASPLRPYVIYLYFVGTDNILKRAQFTGSAMSNVTSLVDGIENLQLEYGVDNDNDGNADTYVANPASVADWANVVTVQINLLARNPETSPGYKDTKIYNLGPSAGAVGPFNDGYRRHVYATLVRIQNTSNRRETP